ncbi:hypothetical protein K501DRAFT_329807 [Backusella circina FSU 941]|nr:hypothetical protein K501DRAFT_329807 [Backusella circina FSU 941]
MGTEDNVIRFVIGIFVSLGASFMDALGLNILKLDHVKESKRAQDQQRGDCGRPLWHIGLYTYIASQLIGSTIALNFLKTQWVAPLGSVALIFNFIFAKLLVGTKITRKDVLGTCVVVASVIWIVVFGGMYNGDDPEESISLESLKIMFVRPIFIIYFSALNILAFGGLFVSIWSNWALSDESRKHQSQVFSGMSHKKMKNIVGLMFSLEGGLLASETLLLAKSGVKLFTLSIKSQINQFNDNVSRFILLALLISAVMQVYCLNTALKLYSSVVVVPVFYGTYTAIGLVNTIIYLDEIGNYPPWAIALVFVGIGVLIYGVFLLSSKPDPSQPMDDDEDDEEQGGGRGIDQELDEMHTPRKLHTELIEEDEEDPIETWLTASEEKEAAAIKSSIGESSKSVQEEVVTTATNTTTTSLSRFVCQIRKYMFRKKRSFVPRREMDTFISLHSSASETTNIPMTLESTHHRHK